MVLCQEAVTLAWKESFRNETNRYFLCEAVGHMPGRCNQDSLKKYSHTFSLMNCIYYTMTAIVPVVNLIFIINCRVVKEAVKGLKVAKALKTISRSSE